MYDFYSSVSDLLVFGVLAAIVVSMIIIAEIMRATAKYCDGQEAANRLRVSIGLFRTAIILLFMYGANQTLETHQLKEVVRNSKPSLDGSKIADADRTEWRIETPMGRVITFTGEKTDGMRNRIRSDDECDPRTGYVHFGVRAGRSDNEF